MPEVDVSELLVRKQDLLDAASLADDLDAIVPRLKARFPRLLVGNDVDLSKITIALYRARGELDVFRGEHPEIFQ